MKAVSGELPPAGDERWVYEIKWDGMRVLADCRHGAGTTTLTTGNGIDATRRFPELHGLAAAIGCDAVVDGEVVAIDDTGRTDFGLLQQRMHLTNPADVAQARARVPVSFAIFDVLRIDGSNVCSLPWTDRRNVLEQLVDQPTPGWRVPATHDDGHALLEVARERGFEGVMAKRRDSVYVPGKRSSAWVKVKVRRRQELVVGGWWPGEGNRHGSLGSLVVGVHDPAAPGNPLRFAGKVGTGFNAAALREYERLLDGLATEDCPFDPRPPAAVSRHARWVRPEVVIEVEFAEWTSEGVLRHPSHIGRRFDKDPTAVVREP
jgi:bifunctional non-homologous end joining protein LigD